MIETLDAPIQILDQPFGTSGRRELDVPHGATIAELLRLAGIPNGTPVRVYLNGDLIYPEFYHVVRPKRGAHILVRVVPRGGGGGQGKNIGMLVLGILLIVVGAYTTIFTAGTAESLVVLGVGMVLSSVINMLIPPPKKPSLKSLAGATSNQEPESPTLSISGQTNTARPYNVVPRIYGTHKTYPPYAAMPFSETVGADQYLRLLFCVGLGPTQIEDLRIGETALANFQNVETEVREGWPDDPPLTLYTTDVNEAPLSIVLLNGIPQIRTSAEDAVELSVDVVFPEGLVQFDNDGNKHATGVQITVEYRLVGAGAWLSTPVLSVVDARQSLTRSGVRWTVPTGQYDVRLTRITADSTDLLLHNTSVWSSLRSYGAGAPVTLPGLALVAMRIKATDQLNGVVDQFNCLAHSLHLDFTTFPAVVEADAPLGYWRLGEVVGAPTAFDFSGHDHAGTYRGNPALGSPGLLAGDRDTALLCDGIDDGVDSFVGLSTTDMGGGDFTVECLIRPATLSGVRGIIHKSNGQEFTSAGIGWALQQNGTFLEFTRGVGSGAASVVKATMISGQIYHVAATYSRGAGVLQLWMNGAPVATAVAGSTAYADSFPLEFAPDRAGGAAVLSAPAPLTGPDLPYFHPNYFAVGYFRPGYFDVTPPSGPTPGGYEPYFHPNYFAPHYFATGYFAVAVMLGVGGFMPPYFFAVPQQVELPPGEGAGGAVPPFWYAIATAPTVGGRYAGTLDEVALYLTALSGGQIAVHYGAFQATSGWAYRRTSNPASHYREVLQGPQNARPVPDSRLDLRELEAWHRENDMHGFTHNRVVDFSTTTYDLLREIAACGRGTPTMNDLLFSVVRDLPQTVPRQIFTPRNSKNFRGTRTLPEEIHGLKVNLVDPQSGWQQVARIAYRDGYGPVAAPGILPASKFDSIDLPGCTDPDMAWKIGRYHLACLQDRPESYELETDIENLACRRGDLIHVAHDVTEWGVAWGRVKTTWVTASGLATGVELDEAVPLPLGQVFAMRFRLADLTSIVTPVSLPPGPGMTTAISFPNPVTPPIPQPGDLALLGVVGKESVPAIVTLIRPGPELSAVLTCVDAAPGVLTADQLPIPPWDPMMTLPIPTEQDPPTPIIDAVVSDESVLIRALDGSLRSAIVVTLHYQATSNIQADYLDARIRRHGVGSPYDALPNLPAGTTRVMFGEVEDGQHYDLRLRTVTRRGPASPWAEVLDYVVVGKLSPPPAPVNVRITDPALTRLEWDYPVPPPDLDGFMIRMSPGATANWEGGVTLHVGVVSASPFILPGIFGQWTLMVAAVDTSGNESPPGFVTATFVDVRIHNAVQTYDFKAAGFPGTIVNGSIVGGNLVATGVPTVFWGADMARYWNTPGTALYWAGTYYQMSYTFSFTPAAGSAGARIVLQVTMVAESWTLEYELTPGNWVPFGGTLETITATAYSFRIITAAAATQAVLSRLTLVVDADTITEDQANVAMAATTGTRLTLQQTYRGLTQVIATVVGDGGAGVTARVMDFQANPGTAGGPLIQVLNTSGAVVAGHVNVRLGGF